jgi:predicted amidohydrolase YtcJ
VPSTPLKPKQKKDAFIDGVQEDYFSKGITATAEMGSVTNTFRMFQELEREGRLKLRVGYYCAGRRNPPQKPMCQRVRDMGLTSGFGSDRVRFLGVKYVMDGSTGGRTAAFSRPYLAQPDNFGELYNDPAILREDFLCCAKAGLQISIHAIGDRAIEGALQAIEFVNAEGVDTRPLHWRLEHVESPTPDQIRRIKELSLSVGLSSAFIYSLGDSHLAALGYDRLTTAFPAKTLLEEGIPVGCNSDCPICDVNPMLGIYSMVTRKTEKGASFGGRGESVSRLEALRTYTALASRLILRDDLGTLSVGKKADITVFDGDFLAMDEEKLKDLTVYSTFSGGEEVWRKK